MNKSDLVNAIASDTNLSKTDATKALDSMINHVQKTLKKGDEVRLVGFGTFKVTKRAARSGRNPRTGETIKIAASKSPAFRPGKEFKDILNK
jgi:DNA-binding protein HU-beta